MLLYFLCCAAFKLKQVRRALASTDSRQRLGLANEAIPILGITQSGKVAVLVPPLEHTVVGRAGVGRVLFAPRPPGHVTVGRRVIRPHPLLLIMLIRVLPQADPVGRDLGIVALHVLRELQVTDHIVDHNQMPVHLLTALIGRSPAQVVADHFDARVAD